MRQLDVLGIVGSFLVLVIVAIAASAVFLFPWLIYRDYKSDVDTRQCIKRKVIKDKWEVKKAVRFCNATN